jgi:triosephosphate isomerase
MFGEDDEIVNKKMKAALGNDFNVVVAVGELQRGDSADDVVLSFKKTMAGIPEDYLPNVVVAYEPVWAIGTGESDDPARSSKIIEQLKNAALKLFGADSKRLHYIYGGSVTSKNAASFLSQRNISGALVGGASLNKNEFLNILKIANAA